MKTTINKHGPGGAHIGFSMFGARGPLREEEGSGGGSSTPPPVAPPAQGEPAPAPGAPAEKLLPQSQVSTLIADAKRDTEAKTRAKVLQEIADKAATPPASKPAPKGDGSMSAEDVQSLLARDRAFTRSTAKADLNERQQSRMEAAFKADAPTDVAAWCAAYIEDLGIVKQPPAVAPTPSGSPAPTTPPPAAPNAPAKVESATANGLPNPWALTADQIDQLGPQGCREMLEKLTTVGRARLGTPPPPKLPARK